MSNEPFSDEKRSRKNESVGGKTEFPTFTEFDNEVMFDSSETATEAYCFLMSAHDTIIAEKDATILKLAKENAIMKEVLHTERRNYTACIKELARLRDENMELKERIANKA